jgi:sugar fermentation stimulation protein A
MNLFPHCLRAEFVSRPNRFTLHCRIGGQTVKAHLPNPGRLWELLLPGAILYLEPRAGIGPRMPYTAVAVEKEGHPVLLHTHRINDLAQYLLEEGLIPGLEGAEVLQREIPMGSSRFDFLLQRGSERILLEVKSCTLFGKRMAMFPDAVTDRGRRHIRDLAAWTQEGYAGAVLFLVSKGEIEYFLPEYHTDLAFSRELLRARHRIRAMALAVSLHSDLSLNPRVFPIRIPWEMAEREGEDRGSYILVLHLREEKTIGVGRQGRVRFPKGYYLYVGSARRNLSQRIARHQRLRKTPFWHIDDLRAHTDRPLAIPIRTEDDLECDLAKALRGLAEWEIPGFGCSDCRCSSHLYGMGGNPLQSPSFISLLHYFRMDRLAEKIRQAPR